MIKSISIVFPLYNEENRLPQLFKEIKKFSTKSKFNIEFIFVNDGSVDNSLNLIKKFKHENIRELNVKIINYKKNRGKGYALKQGVLIANKKWILTMDVDLSVSFKQIDFWVKSGFIKNGGNIFFGSRLLTKSNIKAKKYRVFTGDVFNILLRFIINDKFLNIKDTQCGFKLYKKDLAKIIFKNIKENGYIHDVEILILIRKKKFTVYELPVNWTHKDGSKINIIQDSVKMLINLFHLKLRYKL
jgi:dolichyl-phosphate beta-glucosyltransferase|tara:strand:+ start:110 stop:841 length:732 start_codon:yes stop_codon:yes gene_type:complete